MPLWSSPCDRLCAGCLLSYPAPCVMSPSISLHHLARNLRRSTLNTGAYRPQKNTKKKANRGRGTTMRLALMPVNLLDLDSPGQVASARSFAPPIHFWTAPLSNIARDRR